MKKQIRDSELTDQQLERELQRSVQKRHRWSLIKNTGLLLFVVILAFLLVTSFWIPIYYVTDENDALNGNQGQLLAAIKTDTFGIGDVVLVHHGDDIILRRIAGLPGDSLDIDSNGNLSVNDLSYPAQQQTHMDTSDLQYPYQVPQDSYLLISMNQPWTIESVNAEKLIGSRVFCLWPIQQTGFIR